MQTYKKLFTYRFALIIYDLTVEFCQRWIKDDPRTQVFRGKAAKLVRNLSNLRYLGAEREWQKDLPLPEEAANLMVTLCHQATYLMNKQVEALERKHQTEGGYTEKLYRKRKNYRGY